MEQFIQTLHRNIEIIRKSVETEFYTLSDNALTFKPDVGQWSILECFEHLNRYASYYLPEIQRAIEKASPKLSSSQTIRYTWIGKLSIKSMHPSNTSRQKTFKHMNPAKSQLQRDVLDQFLRHQSHLLHLLESSNSIDANRRSVRLEFFRMMKMKLGEALEFVIVHEQRHLQQAQRVLTKYTQSQPPVLIL